MADKVAFYDIELVDPIPTNWKEDLDPAGMQARLAISCIGYQTNEGVDIVYKNEIDVGCPMTAVQIQSVIDTLIKFQQNGVVVTWNGSGFDNCLLATYARADQDMRAFNRRHIDLMFVAVCVKGYPIGLNAVAKGFAIEGKSLASGLEACELWNSGQIDKVCEYCRQDVSVLRKIYELVEKHKRVKWISKSDRPMYFPLARLYTVGEASNLPLPDTSWMDKAPNREQFIF